MLLCAIVAVWAEVVLLRRMQTLSIGESEKLLFENALIIYMKARNHYRMISVSDLLNVRNSSTVNY